MRCQMHTRSIEKGACSRSFPTPTPAKQALLPPIHVLHALQPFESRVTVSMARSRHVLTRAASAPYASEEEEDVADGPEMGFEDDEDGNLWQFEDRHRWYLPKYSADDAPDWQPAQFVSSHELFPGVREVVLDIEIGRERVPLRNAYRRIGQSLMLRVNGGEDAMVPVTSPLFSKNLNRASLYMCRGDLPAGETKRVSDPLSVRTHVAVYVEEALYKEVYRMNEGDLVEGGGLNLRPVQPLYVYPTIVLFASGAGIAAARAVIESEEDDGGLCFPRREHVVLYYRAPNTSSIAYAERFEQWQSKYNVRVVTSTRDTFQEMFDYDDELMYEPKQTAAIIMTGGNEEEETAAREACREAEIAEEAVVLQSQEGSATRYIEKNGEREF